MNKCNLICPKSCYEELKSLSKLPVKLLIYRYNHWIRVHKVASSDESIKNKIQKDLKIQEVSNILRIYHKTN